MADRGPPIDPDTMSVQELQGWLREEVRDSAKAHELRTKEATQFVEDYAAGKITGEEAMNRLYAYDLRWGDVLPGTTASPGKSDEQILSEIDETQGFPRTRAQKSRERGGDQRKISR
jgi:hypothetical protein